MENIACKRCIDAINTRDREEIGWSLQWEFAVAIGVCCGDSWVKKNQSGAAKAWWAHNPDIANDMSRKAIRQTEQRSGAEQ
jgi:hypothetical protein